jgi:hypothetical protein
MDNIKMENRLGGYKLGRFQDQLIEFCDDSNEPLGYTVAGNLVNS